MNQSLLFPQKFWWGSATSAHQVEGGNVNDWSEWEKSPERLGQLKREGKNPADFISGSACDSFNRYTEDFDIAKSLNHNAHRFSIEWSRIEPEEGKFDHDAMRHYIAVVDALRERGMEPIVTLWHFANPLWFARKGGFLNKRAPELFSRYVQYVVDNLKDRVGMWITFNEATTVYAGWTYLKGFWPPNHESFFEFLRFRKNIIHAHTITYRAIKNAYKEWPGQWDKEKNLTSHNIVGRPVLIGIVENNSYVVAGSIWKTLGADAIFRLFSYDSIWRRFAPYCDFLGLNYYTTRRLPGSFETLPRQSRIEEMDWEIYPEGIYHVLKNLKKFNKPILITENGIADTTDQRREQFIKDHLYWVWRAIQDGVDVRGYLYWSLLDNFEWALGFTPRFGLTAVNYHTFERAVRPSARAYATIISNNGFEYQSP